MELANGAAQASTRCQVMQHPGATHRGNAEPLGERMQGAAQAGLDDEGALDAGPPLAFDEGRQRKGIDSLGHGQPPARPSAPIERAGPQSGSKLLSTRAVQAASRQRMRICSRGQKERLEANREFPWRFSGDFERGRRSGGLMGPAWHAAPGSSRVTLYSFWQSSFRGGKIEANRLNSRW